MSISNLISSGAILFGNFRQDLSPSGYQAERDAIVAVLEQPLFLRSSSVSPHQKTPYPLQAVL